MEHPGERLRVKREKRRLTQLELARLVGCHDSYIALLEGGKRPGGPGRRIALALERAIGLKAESWDAVA